MRWRFSAEIETGADLIPTSLPAGNYQDPDFVGRMAATVMQRYDADENGRIVSFKLERVQDMQ